MSENRNKTVDDSSGAARERTSSGLRRALFAFLFSAILLIPRVRRLRRKVLAWTLIRVVAVFTGAWLAWRFFHGTTAAPSLLFALGLALFGLLVKARPERKSLDDVARELNALVAVNGGSWVDEHHSKPLRETTILVASDRLVVLAAGLQRIVIIPLGSVREVRTQASLPESAPRNGIGAPSSWQMNVVWNFTGEDRAATFRFEGFFAEHLAQVAERTITSVWKKQLPVLKS